MMFTYQAYRDLLALLRRGNYEFCDYHNYSQFHRCVILRHDIDCDLEQAVRLAEIEMKEGVKSTYFLLLRTDFYNPASKVGAEKIHRILSFGHEIGLHFDETAYDGLPDDEAGVIILRECRILSEIIEAPVTTVSMHRPSKAALEADFQIPGIVNSYSKTFFREFKYLSDSRRRWREPILDIIRSGAYERLHITTHAFWYHEQEENIAETVENFIRSAYRERYHQMAGNITDLASIMREDSL